MRTLGFNLSDAEQDRIRADSLRVVGDMVKREKALVATITELRAEGDLTRPDHARAFAAAHAELLQIRDQFDRWRD